MTISNVVTVINRGLRSKRKRKDLDSRITHTHTTHNSIDDEKFGTSAMSGLASNPANRQIA